MATAMRSASRWTRTTLPSSRWWLGESTPANCVPASPDGELKLRLPTPLPSQALLLFGDAVETLHAAGVGEFISTDNVPHESNGIATAALLAEALQQPT